MNDDLEKLRVLLPHWIEHQAEHVDELRAWAERIQLAGRTDVASGLLAAAASLEQSGEQLSELLHRVGETAASAFSHKV